MLTQSVKFLSSKTEYVTFVGLITLCKLYNDLRSFCFLLNI